MKKQKQIWILFRMLKLVKPLSGYMILAILFGTLGFLTAQFIPILGGMAILEGLGMSYRLHIFAIVVLLLVFALFRGIFRYTEQRLNHFIAFTILALIRDLVFQALRRLCPAKLEAKDKGNLISLITSDVELLEVFYAHTISPICIAIVTESLMCLFIGSFHPALGCLSFIAFFLVGVLVPLLISKRSGRAGEEIRGQAGELSAHMLESIRGVDDILQYAYGEKRLKEISEKTKDLSKQQGFLSRLTGSNLASANLIILLSDLAMLCLAAFLYQMGQVEFDGFLLPLIALMSSFGPVTALAALGTTLQNTIASAARVLAIIDDEPETEDLRGYAPITFHGVEVENLTFSYGGEKVLDNLSLSIPEKEILGIIGKSGCGKSTLLKLLMRFWKKDAGDIYLSNRSIEEINTENLRNMESYMTQETQLFKDTIAGNLRIAKLDASQEEIIAACKKASIHDFIMTLPKGYETEVGELGTTLSGGERQRIGLASAFLHDAPFLLLDEPTSNLDSLNEAVILKSLRESAKEKTVLLVSHRESTMRICDRCFAMENRR